MDKNSLQTLQVVAESVKSACVQAAIDGYANAKMSGLCHDGASEAAVSAIQMVDVDTLLQKLVLVPEPRGKR